MAKKIFINYRRDDSEGDSGRLHDQVAGHAGKKNVFWDRDDLGPGDDFVDKIAAVAADADILLAVVGPNWASPHNLERLHDDNDWVRRELESGVRSASTQVVPVLVRGATWPPNRELPASLQPMIARQAWPIRADQFDGDVANLLRRLNVPNRRTRLGAIALAIAVLAAGAFWIATRNGDITDPTTTQAAAATTTEPEATTTSAATTTTLDLACGPVSSRSLPVEATNVDTTDGDFDGDGRLDSIFAYNVAGSPDISRFMVQLDNGYTHEFVDNVFFQLLPPQFLGTLDINGDGQDESFVRYAGGASTNTIRVLTFADCRLATLGEFLVGGSVGFGSGLACQTDDADLVVYSAEINGEGDGYLISSERYTIVGPDLELTEETSGVVVDLADQLVNAAYGLDCGNLEF